MIPLDQDARELHVERLLEGIERICAVVSQTVRDDNRERILGSDIGAVFHARAGHVIPLAAVVKLALLADCLRVIDLAIHADGQASTEELEFVLPLVYPAANFYAKLCAGYQGFAHPDSEGVAAFLRHQRDDLALQWPGLDICQRLAAETGDREALEIYRHMIIELHGEILALGGITAEEAAQRAQLRDFIELGKRMDDAVAPASEDARTRAFCARGPSVFSATAHAHQVWTRDPFDVESIHVEARHCFERMVERMTTPILQDHGRILLVLGPSGSGKTHLMRAFRSHLHARHRGYAGYMQLSSRTSNYARYVLVNLLDSLERPYDPPLIQDSALMCLARAVAETADGIRPEDLARLREGQVHGTGQEPGRDLVAELADRVLATDLYSHFDLDLVRALLQLERRDPPVTARVLKYLRCEPLNAEDLRLLGDLAPRTNEEDPQRMLLQLGRVMWATQQACLVLMVDQIEDFFHLEDSTELFRRAVNVLRAIVDHLPSAIVVISCLEDFYSALRPQLNPSVRDRIERDPEPVRLADRRSLDEIEALISQRLAVLYDVLDVRHRDDEPTFPLRREHLEPLANLRTRDVLDWCRQYHEQCQDAGALVERPAGVPMAAPLEPQQHEVVALAQAWNDFRAEHGTALPEGPEGDDQRLALLGWAAEACMAEPETGWRVAARATEQGLELHMSADGAPQGQQILVMAMCNQSPRGGWLGREISILEEHASARRASASGPAVPMLVPVAVRCSQFPDSAKTAALLGEFRRRGGRCVAVEDAEWRAMEALRAFRMAHQGEPALDAWLRSARPLAGFAAVRALLDLDEHDTPRIQLTPAVPAVQAAEPAPSRHQPDAPVAAQAEAQASILAVAAEPARAAPLSEVSQIPRIFGPAEAAGPAPGQPAPGDPLLLGKTASLVPEPVRLDPAVLCRHAAFLGSTGSGKTTLALAMIEQLLGRGVSALLVDRKGDLCRYGDAAWWDEQPEDPVRRSRKAWLRSRLDVRVYTPGAPGGQPLALSVIPTGMRELPSSERSQVARHAATALGTMMGYKDGSRDRACLGILVKAIELLGEAGVTTSQGLEPLIDLVHARDAALVHAVGRLDDKHFGRLVEDLTSLQILRGNIFHLGAPLLSASELLGPPAAPGTRTRLSIISTRSLGDSASIEFWITRLLIEIERWTARQQTPELRAVLFLDEADSYLPAVGKPATKEPLLSLLRRARSAGLGVLLATQNPGDLDYKSRDNIGTWLVGKIAADRAIGKMKLLLGDYQLAAAQKLATQRAGEFFLLSNGAATPLRAERAIMDPVQLGGEDQILAIARQTRAT